MIWTAGIFLLGALNLWAGIETGGQGNMFAAGMCLCEVIHDAEDWLRRRVSR